MISVITRGGIGNQCYMMAAAYGHALRHGYDCVIPLEVDNPHYEGQKPYIFPGLNYCDKVPDLPRYNEPYYHYAEIPPKDNIVLNGYFQSFRYIGEYRSEILNAFDFKWEHEPNVCAVHIRRGDYMRLPDHHPFVGEEYLTDSLYEMNKRTGITRFRIFSNDIPWCKEFFSNLSAYTFEFVEGNTEYEDLRQGSCCANQILSNGTFALWQYYLNQNPDKICIAPKRWFGKLLPHDTADLYPENCILL